MSAEPRTSLCGGFQFSRRVSTVPKTPASLQNPAHDSGAETSVVLSPAVETTPLPVTTKTRKITKRASGKLYRSIDAELPEEQRFKVLVKRLLADDYAKMAGAPAAAREEYEKVMLNVLEANDAAVQSATKEGSALASRRRTNPTEVELRKRLRQLEAVVDSYKNEREEWERAQAELPQLSKLLCKELPPVPPLERLTGAVDPSAVALSAKAAVEMYVLHTDHMTHVLKGLESRQRQTNSFVTSVADSINAHVLREPESPQLGPLLSSVASR